MLRVIIFLQLLFFAVIANSQISFYPEIDSTSKNIYALYKQKKISIAKQLVNNLISANPSDGINYFNRAVLLFYSPNYPGSTKKPVSDERIVSDCKKSIQLGYNSSEIYYLLFSQYYNCDPKNEHMFGCVFVNTGDSMINRFDQLKSLIDTAIMINPYNEKYLWAEIQLFDQYFYDRFDNFTAAIPTMVRDCHRLLETTKIKKRKFVAYYLLGNIYEEFFVDSLKAIEYYSAAMDVDPKYNDPNIPNDADPHRARGDLRKDFNNDYEAAIEDYNIYLRKQKDAIVFYNRAWCYFMLGKDSNALKDLNSAILLNDQERKSILDSDTYAMYKLDAFKGRWGNTYALRGIVSFYLNNKREALKDFNKAIEYGSQKALKSKAEFFGDIDQNQDNIQDSKIVDNSISMIKNGSVYEIPITINNTLKINFIFDSGASDVSISPDVVLTLIRTGTITDQDFIGTESYKFADGSVAKSKVLIIKELQIGNKIINNVKASISNSIEAPLLLGQSVLNRFGKVTIDYKNGVIHFED